MQVAVAPPPAILHPIRSMDNPFESHPRVFIVDDEMSIAKMMSVVLQMNLLDAVPYDDPQQALAAARETPPDYLISDIMMKGMTGIELATFIRQEIPACKILLFSGQPDAPQMVQQAKSAGFDFPFLQKPIHPTELVAVLKGL
jgi:DNA-binding NtrC family response regulator